VHCARLFSFNFGGSKFVRFLAKTELIPRQLLFFVNRHNAELTKLAIILVNKNKMSENWSY
jgi:hypothetical protein